MSDVLIRQALEVRLAAMMPVLETAFENREFKPTPGVPYQRVEIVRAQPENPTFDSFKRMLGFMQVTMMYPPNKGPGVAEARAQALSDHFPRKLNLTAGSVIVTISATAQIMGGFQDEDRWAVPVRVPYYANLT
jgi:hypothetical protein